MSITIDSIPEIPLTPRQRLVACELAAGLTRREIAARLGCSVKTVDTHRGAALERIGARNVADLTRYAIAAGLVTVDGIIVPELEQVHVRSDAPEVGGRSDAEILAQAQAVGS